MHEFRLGGRRQTVEGGRRIVTRMAERRWGLRAMWAYHRFVDRITRGRATTDRVWQPTLWLTTIGRKSGLVRENAVIYLADGPNLIVVASNAGADEDPAWFRNLIAKPATTVRIGTERRNVTARVATDEEAAALWLRLDRLYPTYATYRSKTDRTIQIVILEPRASPTPADPSA
jgi:deazaflavin-dependent oxidoreductase (nitroreductase family)